MAYLLSTLSTINWLDPFFLSQCLIAVAIIFDFFSFQFKERRKIVACLFVAGLLITAHFILLEKWTATALMVFATLRYLSSIVTTSKKMMWFFSACSVIATSITFSGLISIISCIGTLFQTRASFCESDKQLRQLMIVGTSFWLIHNYMVGSPAAVVMELLFISSNLIGYYRHYIRPTKALINTRKDII